MPLDGHSYLLSKGWTGKGTGLRHGAIARPLAIPQKRTLAGLGKDRDEAFPFWDHLFSAAAKSIQLKVTRDDEEDNGSDSATLEPVFKRTATGILSNRRPVTGTPATTSGINTPAGDRAPRSSLISIAKREAARCGLYARFFRGPILGPNDCDRDNISVQDGADLKSVDGKLMKRTHSGDDDDDEKRRKKQKKDRKNRNGKRSVCKEGEEAHLSEDDRGVLEKKKKRRKRETEVGEDLVRKKKAEKEKTDRVHMTLESGEGEGENLEVSQDRPRKKKRRKKAEDRDGLGTMNGGGKI